jgi:hypothetical protein
MKIWPLKVNFPPYLGELRICDDDSIFARERVLIYGQMIRFCHPPYEEFLQVTF